MVMYKPVPNSFAFLQGFEGRCPLPPGLLHAADRLGTIGQNHLSLNNGRIVAKETPAHVAAFFKIGQSICVLTLSVTNLADVEIDLSQDQSEFPNLLVLAYQFFKRSPCLVQGPESLSPLPQSLAHDTEVEIDLGQPAPLPHVSPKGIDQVCPAVPNTYLRAAAKWCREKWRKSKKIVDERPQPSTSAT